MAESYINRTESDRRTGVYRRFRDISISERILNTAFLLTIGIGYLAPYVRIVVVFFEIDNWGRNGRKYATLS